MEARQPPRIRGQGSLPEFFLFGWHIFHDGTLPVSAYYYHVNELTQRTMVQTSGTAFSTDAANTYDPHGNQLQGRFPMKPGSHSFGMALFSSVLTAIIPAETATPPKAATQMPPIKPSDLFPGFFPK